MFGWVYLLKRFFTYVFKILIIDVYLDVDVDVDLYVYIDVNVYLIFIFPVFLLSKIASI